MDIIKAIVERDKAIKEKTTSITVDKTSNEIYVDGKRILDAYEMNPIITYKDSKGIAHVTRLNELNNDIGLSIYAAIAQHDIIQQGRDNITMTGRTRAINDITYAANTGVTIPTQNYGTESTSSSIDYEPRAGVTLNNEGITVNLSNAGANLASILMPEPVTSEVPHQLTFNEMSSSSGKKLRTHSGTMN